ncbi:MAG: alpha/beta hydrolase [Candidatus Krumholzibacteriia bacterium]
MDRLRPAPALGLCVILAAAAAAGPASAVPVTFEVAVPAGTDPAAAVHIAGDFQGWDPGAPDCRLVREADGLHRITLDLPAGGAIGFKFTLGHWGVVEKGPGGEEIPNRTLTVSASGKHRFTVASWASNPAPALRESSRTGTIETFTVPEFLEGRRVWAYLPPGYAAEPGREYPVLYMFDGQNLFDAAAGFAGEWRVDETCEDLITAGRMRPVIVVGMENGGRDRIREYTPWADPRRGGGGGEDHLEAVITTLMPAVAARYRVLAGPEHTGLAGSSLGGLMALYGGLSRPDVFGLVGAFSTTVHWAGYRLTSWTPGRAASPLKVYLDMGDRESGSREDTDGNGVADPFDDLRRMQAALEGLGLIPGVDLMAVEDAGGIHNESAWARRLPGALIFLFPPDGP